MSARMINRNRKLNNIAHSLVVQLLFTPQIMMHLYILNKSLETSTLRDLRKTSQHWAPMISKGVGKAKNIGKDPAPLTSQL
jgi:hypothetical protein